MSEQPTIVYVKHNADEAGWPVFCPTAAAASSLVEDWADKMVERGVVKDKDMAAWEVTFLYGERK
jgi:hypothetical protein